MPDARQPPTTRRARVPAGPRHPTAVGVIVPHDMVLDHELWRWAPDGVSLLFTRTPFVDLPVSVEQAEQVGDERAVERCAQDLAAASIAAYAYACTSGSFVYGAAGERRLVEVMRDAGGAPAVTTSGAVVEALRHLGVNRVAVASPYDPYVTDRMHAYLGELGVEVVASSHLGLTGGIWRVPYAATAELVRRADTEDADAVVVPCTNLPTYGIIAPLEDRLAKPVVTANQATVWAALRAIGLQPARARQRLLAEAADQGYQTPREGARDRAGELHSGAGHRAADM